MFFVIQCEDTTGLYSDSLEGIKIANVSENIVQYSDNKGRSQVFPLISPNTRVKLRLSKEPIFPLQTHETSIQRGEIARIILDPKKGSMTLRVIYSDRSLVRAATVTLEGDGYFSEETTSSNGTALFQSPRIRPFKKFKVTVEKGVQRQTYNLWSKGWSTEEELTLYPVEGTGEGK